jgi:hypothetical protein
MEKIGVLADKEIDLSKCNLKKYFLLFDKLD